MKKVYKTKDNLATVWNQLDEACGSLDNATMALGSMTNLPANVVKAMECVDFSALVTLKNAVEEMLEEKER
ncbi:hypothetical protein M3_0178 [Lysinibacillus phage vB_LfM_LysYB1]|nr:hypothetical protein M3_0178 [Lysinibacillus phage vB_LfM_LysYB1]WAB25311.1 hypothetical protein M5_0133 [Lysinibacillus phage vB_LfM_LysYB2]